MSRVKPDGSELNWRMTLNKENKESHLPFILDWGSSVSPKHTTVKGVVLLEI